MNTNLFTSQKKSAPLRTKSILLLTCLSLRFGSYEAKAKFPLNVFKGVTDSFLDDKKYMTPTLGIAALDTGSIGNIRFYGNFTPAYRTSSTGDQERDYANDHSKDPVWQLVRILFPSTAGQLSADSTYRLNFGKYVKNPITIALLLKYADDVRSTKQVDEEQLKNNLMASLGLPFDEKKTPSQSIDLGYDTIESDRNLINEMIEKSQQTIDNLEVSYKMTKDAPDQKTLKQEKLKLIDTIKALIKQLKNESTKSIFMERIQDIYQMGAYDLAKQDPQAYLDQKNRTTPNPRIKKSPLDPDYFYRVKNELLKAKSSAEKNEGTLVKKGFEKAGTKDSSQRFITAFKTDTLTPLLTSIKKAITDEQSDQDQFYPKYMTEQIISAFFSYKFSTREDIQHLLTDLQALTTGQISSYEEREEKCKNIINNLKIENPAFDKATIDDIKSRYLEKIEEIHLKGKNSQQDPLEALMAEMSQHLESMFADLGQDSPYNPLEIYKNQALDSQIINKGALASFDPNDLLTGEQLRELAQKKDYSLDDILALATADIWSMPTPYRVGAPILSNGNTKRYDRATDTFFTPEFADCVEISIRHLINCFLYDPLRRDFNFSELTKYQASLGAITPEQQNIFAAFKDFYAQQTVDLANEGSINMRSQWNRVVGDLNSATESPESAVRYRQQNNELDAGFINLMKVFHKIIGVKIDAIPFPDAPLDQKKEWLAKSFRTIFKALNPNAGYSIDVNMDHVMAQGPEISGIVTITVKGQSGGDLYSFDFSSNPDRHGQFQNYQVSDALTSTNYEENLESSNFKAVGAENVIWLMQKGAQYTSISYKVYPLYGNKTEQDPLVLYDLYPQDLSDNLARIGFLEMLEYLSKNPDNRYKKFPPIDLLKVLLKNVLSDMNLEDELVLDKVSRINLTLYKDERFKEVIREVMRVVKLGERQHLSWLGSTMPLIWMALRENNPISSLDLSKSLFNAEQIIALTEALQKNTSLSSLNLTNAGIRGGKIGPKEATILVDFLKTNNTLSSLNLSYNNIGDEGAIALAEALKTNASVKNLDLGANNITSKGIIAFAEGLKNNTTLSSLNLTQNRIDDDSVLALAENLKNNTSLTSLSLNFNIAYSYIEVTDKGAKALEELLEKNTSITNLDLGGCNKTKISPETCEKLKQKFGDRLKL